MHEYYYDFKLAQMVNQGENILWQGKPDKKCFILESIFNPFLPFAFIWFMFDAFFIAMTFGAPTINFNGENTETHKLLGFLIPFFALHMMPVWIYLAGVLLTGQKHKNTEYIITDKAVYISGGVFNYSCTRRLIEKIAELQLRQGYFDRMLNVGDVIIEKYITGCGKSRRETEVAIADIPDFRSVNELIIKLQSDIQEKNKIQNSYDEPTDEDDAENTDIE